MSKWLVVVTIVLLVAAPALAQDDDGWRLVSAQRLSDLIPGEYRFESARLSPDGTMLGWRERGETEEWCIYTFADEAVNCVPREDEAQFNLTRYNLPVWSPDGTEIVFYEDLFMLAEESDLWTLDVTTGKFTNRTDDSYEGTFIDPDMPDNVPFDYTPAYSPADGLLYFFRSVRRDGDPGFTLELMRLTGDGEPEQVVDLTPIVPGPLAVYRPPVFSPDGSQMAFLALPGNFREEPRSGVWLLDMDTLEARPLAGLMYFDSFKPEFAQGGIIPTNLIWGDGGLVVETTNPAMNARALIAATYQLDPETGALTPMLDLSEYGSEAELLTDGSATGANAAAPLAGVVLPGGSTYWYISLAPDLELTAVRAAPLPFTGEPPDVVMPLEYWATSTRYGEFPVASSDGKALIYDMLLTFERE